mmetsp:Transcript_24288/g.72528  ORF Transcript_24288/g.72528 Transcript_24288/m.72528 type:complete len:459 (+) Transcript_24288:35-1411(+)
MQQATAAAAVLAVIGAGATVQHDVDLTPCPDCLHSTWEVLEAPADPTSYPGHNLTLPVAPEVDHFDNGVSREEYDGYSAIIAFGGYSSYGLCTRYERSAPIDGHTKCPLKKDWYTMWRPTAQDLADLQCWRDDMVTYPNGKGGYNAAPGTTTILGACPAAGAAPPTPAWKGYDFRYGGIRPQDNPEAALYPMLSAHITDLVNRTGKKVLIRGCSGGTINGYAFMMSQPKEWRQKHILAFLAVAPVFGGTITSVSSIVYGWQVGGGDVGRCIGRSVAVKLPSVLWMWPHPGEGIGEWNKTEVIVQTPARNYTAYDFDRLLTDIGLTETEKIYAIEKNDFLAKFEPPMVDTYVFYGYGINTAAGYSFRHNFSVKTDGPGVCPPSDQSTLSRPWDDGDVTAPRRSCARAQAWAEAHAREGYVLRNVGYKGQAHGCDCKTDQCKKDYQCILDKLAGKEHRGC